VDFFSGIAAVVEGLGAGVSLGLLLADGDDDLVGEAEAEAFGFGFGVGEAVFSVVTETLGSDAVASGVAGGDEVTSWASATGTITANKAATARTAFFIWFSLLECLRAFPARESVINLRRAC
jgi:hypothetical protein